MSSTGAPLSSPHATFLFLSQVLGRRVVDAAGEHAGKVHDLVARIPDPYPAVERLVIARGSVATTLLQARWADAALGDDGTVRLKVAIGSLPAWGDAGVDGMLRLRGDLLDRLIIDTAGRRVVRVNDVHLLSSDGEIRIAHLDTGLRGIVRRLGLERPVDTSVRTILGRSAAYLRRDAFVSWKSVEMLARNGGTRLRDLHPAELAEVMEDLDACEREALFKSLDSETAAEALSEVEDPRVQETLLGAVDQDRAADILDEMPPDEAADLLGGMPTEKAHELMGKMEAEEASTVKELLQHGEDTAGGLMTTEFIDVRVGRKVREIYDVLRHEAREAEIIYYLYVVDADGRLAGVVSLKDLVLADPDRTVDEVMARDPAFVNVDDDRGRVAEITTRYHLIAIPVVDAEHRLKGVITIDDVFDMVLETGWHKKLSTSSP